MAASKKNTKTNTVVASTKAHAASGWASAKAAAQHPIVVNSVKAVGIVAGVGIGIGVISILADKTYAALA